MSRQCEKNENFTHHTDSYSVWSVVMGVQSTVDPLGRVRTGTIVSTIVPPDECQNDLEPTGSEKAIELTTETSLERKGGSRCQVEVVGASIGNVYAI